MKKIVRICIFIVISLFAYAIISAIPIPSILTWDQLPQPIKEVITKHKSLFEDGLAVFKGLLVSLIGFCVTNFSDLSDIIMKIGESNHQNIPVISFRVECVTVKRNKKPRFDKDLEEVTFTEGKPAYYIWLVLTNEGEHSVLACEIDGNLLHTKRINSKESYGFLFKIAASGVNTKKQKKEIPREEFLSLDDRDRKSNSEKIGQVDKTFNDEKDISNAMTNPTHTFKSNVIGRLSQKKMSGNLQHRWNRINRRSEYSIFSIPVMIQNNKNEIFTAKYKLYINFTKQEGYVSLARKFRNSN